MATAAAVGRFRGLLEHQGREHGDDNYDAKEVERVAEGHDIRLIAHGRIHSPAGVAAWLQELIEYCINERQSALIDLGGGDTTLRSLAAEMPGLATHIEAAGMAPVMFHLTGPQPEDLLPALTLAARGFTPMAQALVFNEYAIEPGSNRERAFARLIACDAYPRPRRQRPFNNFLIRSH
jgi:hypothetical protein